MRSTLPQYLLAGLFGALAMAFYSARRQARSRLAEPAEDDPDDGERPASHLADGGPSIW